MKPKELTLADHAEAWTREQGKRVPKRNTKAWQAMYERWIDFAFSDLTPEPKSKRAK